MWLLVKIKRKKKMRLVSMLHINQNSKYLQLRHAKLTCCPNNMVLVLLNGDHMREIHHMEKAELDGKLKSGELCQRLEI